MPNESDPPPATEPAAGGVIGRVNERATDAAGGAAATTGQDLLLKIGLGILAFLIMIGALIVILQNVFMAVPR
jgi:hypothetical protein